MTGTTSSGPSPTTAASPWRRIAAYFVDYFVFIVPLLGLLSLCGLALWSFGITPSLDNPWVNQGVVILVLTLPIVLYFALSESSRWQATFGKRLMKMAVVDTSEERATFKQTAIRAVVKFLPWEFFHTIYWHWEGWPTNPAPPTTLQIISLSVGWFVIGWFIVSLFVGSGRTAYDLAAGTIVVKRPSALAGTGV
jgi:uncharacterized RDD family membrane protein YckC